MSMNKKDYLAFVDDVPIFFAYKDVKKIRKMKESEVLMISTVCPDYPSKNHIYTFQGQLGSGISLAADLHIEFVPKLINFLKTDKDYQFKINWLVLVADLPELVSEQKEFYERVAGSKAEYLRRCEKSAEAIFDKIGSLAQVETFSTFYSKHIIDYMDIQEEVANNILNKIKIDGEFEHSFNNFQFVRRELSEKFRGRSLTHEEQNKAAAHAMSLYITHGTLLRRIFFNKNFIVINHSTENLRNFFLYQLVRDSEKLEHTQKFPIGIIDKQLY